MYIGNPDCAAETLNQECGKWYDYWDPWVTDDEYEDLMDVDVTKLHTVGDVKKVDASKLASAVDCVMTESGTLYRNFYNIMTPEQVAQLFQLVLQGYEDSQPVAFFDIHV